MVSKNVLFEIWHMYQKTWTVEERGSVEIAY